MNAQIWQRMNKANIVHVIIQAQIDNIFSVITNEMRATFTSIYKNRDENSFQDALRALKEIGFSQMQSLNYQGDFTPLKMIRLDHIYK